VGGGAECPGADANIYSATTHRADLAKLATFALYESVDTDGDGLLDDIERDVYGTDPLLADTDADGLEDGEELEHYDTDPLLADTE
jgi:Bacterial TSP3 repeat